jgi:protein O-GlcNAc transferase
MTEAARDPLAEAFAAYQRGDAAHCVSTLEAHRDAWTNRPDGWLIRGAAARSLGRLAEAEAAYLQAIALLPGYPEAWQNLGNLYATCGRHDAAVTAYGKALDSREDLVARAQLLTSQAGSAFSAGLIDIAMQAVEEAAAAAPDLGAVHNQRGKVYWELGHTDRAIDAFRRATACDPTEALYATNYLLVSQFSERRGEADLAALAAAAAGRIVQGVPDSLRATFRPPARHPGERVRIAYLSSDFRASAPGFFIQSILEGHDRTRFEVWALTTSAVKDALTAKMQGCVDHWVDVSALGPGPLTQWIREQRIHVLVDLNGYTGGHRLAVFAARAAPVQATWLGYEGSTQLPGMDVFLGDPFVSPPENHGSYSERVLTLPFDFACYSPPDFAPAVGPSPALRNGYVTFGSFNKLAKLGPATLALWARILGSVPESRLLIKWRHAEHPFARNRILAALADHGIDGSRVAFRDSSPHAAMLGEYGDVDIALDPMPFSGGATTCDALWMGVPVITRVGRRFASNHTVSHLRAAGLAELVAEDDDPYVAIASGLARDVPALDRLRQSLREQVRHSPLCQPRLFMRPVERHFERLLDEVSRA